MIQLRAKTVAIRNENEILQVDNSAPVGDDEVNESVDEMMEYLKSNAGPLDTVLKYWDRTRLVRIQMLEDQSISTHSYLQKFRALETFDGVKLVINLCEHNI